MEKKRTVLPLKPKQHPDKPGRSMPEKKKPDLDIEDLARPPNSQDLEELQSVEPKGKLTERETKLIELFLSFPTEPKWKITKLAGYRSQHKSTLCNIFNMVIEKYESHGEAKAIFRQIGVGEGRLALRIKELMDQSKNLTVALSACTLAAKCLGLTKDTLELPPGFGINIIRAETQTKPADTGPHRKVVQPGPKQTITK